MKIYKEFLGWFNKTYPVPSQHPDHPYVKFVNKISQIENNNFLCNNCRHKIEIEELINITWDKYSINNYCTLTGRSLIYPIKSCSRYEVNDE